MVAPSGAIRSDLTTEPCRGRSIRLAVLIGLTLTAGAVLASARQFTSGVNVVEVYATVTDKAGKPVTGLGREAFTVRENGEAQQIGTFAAGEFPLRLRWPSIAASAWPAIASGRRSPAPGSSSEVFVPRTSRC